MILHKIDFLHTKLKVEMFGNIDISVDDSICKDLEKISEESLWGMPFGSSFYLTSVSDRLIVSFIIKKRGNIIGGIIGRIIGRIGFNLL